MDIKKMRACSPLLPDPGGEVVRECLDEIERLRTVAEQLAAAAHLVLMRAQEQPGPFKQLIDAGSLQEALAAYNAVPNDQT